MNSIANENGAKRGRWAGKAIAWVAAATLGLTGLALPSSANAVEAGNGTAVNGASQEDTPFDYYSDVTNLPASHVFENITLERLEDILKNGSGNYAILIGGTWDANVTKALPVINKVAQAKGITKVYNFDPHLDNAGDSTLVNINDKNNKVASFAKRFQQTVDDFGLKDIQSKDASQVVDLPTLFTYNKDASGDKVLSVAAGADSVANEATVGTALSAIANNAAVRTNGDFYVDYYLTHNSQGQASVFKSGEQKDVKLVSVTYGELEKILQSEGSHYIFFGATWCGNTYATIRYVNQEASKYGVDHVYTFDTILDNTSGKNSPFHIRDNYSKSATGDHPLADLYTHLVNAYLPNLVTEDGSHGVIDSTGTGATRLQVPLLLHYNRDNTAQLAGTDQPAGPITDEVVDYHGARNNVDTKPQPTAREYMLAWAGTTYDDSQIIPGGYSITGDDLNAAHNFGRTVTNDRDAYIAQLDHFYSLTSLRGTIDAAKSVPLDGYAQANVDAFNTAIANAQKTVSNKTATIDATDGAITAIANAQKGLAGGNIGNNGNTGNNTNNGANKGTNTGKTNTTGTKNGASKNAAGVKSLSNTGSAIVPATVATLVLLLVGVTGAAARRRVYAQHASGSAKH